MKVWLNGECVESHGASNIQELARRFGFEPNSVLIEHNGLALHSREWSDRRVAENDRIEFVRVVAGG